MKKSAEIIAIVVAIFTAIISLSIFFLWYRRRRRPQQRHLPSTVFDEAAAKSRHDGGASKIATAGAASIRDSLRFHHLNKIQIDHEKPPTISIFRWEDHPQLVTEAVENGWLWFSFIVPSLSASKTPSPLLSRLCIAGDDAEGVSPREPAEVSWEFQPGSSELMQTVRINPANRSNDNNTCIRMRVPLPGPYLPASPFPQEAYFEITVLALQPLQQKHYRASKRAKENSNAGGEGDRAKLIHGNSSDANKSNPLNEMNYVQENAAKYRNLVIFLGLTVDGYSSNEAAPGTYPGSVGFSSNGCMFVDGMELDLGDDKTEWASRGKVVGCGFDPSKKRLFFTVDSEVVHRIDCNSDVYKNPLFPVISANGDVTVSVNLGQATFRYSPANSQRTPNPCFIRHRLGTDHDQYEDSKELFSMGRIDSKWKEAVRSKANSNSSSKKSNGNFGDDESELFEIAID